MADATLKNGQKLTDANPQQKDFLWSSGVMLVDYKSAKGDKLQGALFLPANYEKGKKYPTLVYYYEKSSEGLNRYAQPSANGFNKSVYTSNGYAVFMPDITYKINDPGMSAAWCVLPALDAAVATGVVDRAKVCRFTVQEHHFIGTHGSFIRGGDKMLGLPAHSLGRNNFVQTQLAIRSGQAVPQYLLVGHLHRPIQLPTTLGSILVNGGFPGIDGFGLMEAFNAAYPSQRFFLVHSRFAISASYELRLELGDATPHHYSLPDQFYCK